VRTIELFCGTKSFSNVAEERGHYTFTTDINPIFNPTLCRNILDLKNNELSLNPDVLWASPPCTCFSVASIGRHWNIDKTPKTDNAREAIKIIDKTLDIINFVKPKLWFIENPRGMMRNIMSKEIRRLTVTYCQYGDTRMKPTDIWTNCGIELMPPCKNGSPCHQAAPRGARTGTQGIKGAINRGKIPKQLMEDIINYCELKSQK